MTPVHGLPVPESEPEPYLTRQQLADLLQVSVDTIDKMVKAGMPSEDWGLRVRRFRPSKALAWARAQNRRAA